MCKSYNESVQYVTEVYQYLLDTSIEEIKTAGNEITLKHNILLYSYILQGLFGVVERARLIKLVGSSMAQVINFLLNVELKPYQNINEPERIRFCDEMIRAIKDTFDKLGYMGRALPHLSINGFQLNEEIHLLTKASHQAFPDLIMNLLSNVLLNGFRYVELTRFEHNDIVGAVYHVYNRHYHCIITPVANTDALTQDYLEKIIVTNTQAIDDLLETNETAAAFISQRQWRTLPTLLIASETENQDGSIIAYNQPRLYHVWPNQFVLLIHELARLVADYQEVVAEEFFAIFPPNRQDLFSTRAAVERLEGNLHGRG